MENFSPDDCFDEMAKVLMPDREPSEVGYIELLEEVKKLKNDLRLCADGLIPDGMVGGIVECERELRHKAQQENRELKEEIQHKNEKFSEWCVENRELQEEVKKYKRLASDLKQAIICKVA